MMQLAAAMPHHTAYAKARSDQPRLIPLTRELLHRAIAMERDRSMRRYNNLTHIALVPGNSVAGVEGSALLAAGGIAMHSSGGNMQVWMTVSRQASKRQITQIVRLSNLWLDIKAKQHPVLDCYVRALAPYRESFMRALHFRETGAVIDFDPDVGPLCAYTREVI